MSIATWVIYTYLYLPLVDASSCEAVVAGDTIALGEAEVVEGVFLIGIDNTEVISSAQEVAFVLEACTDTPRDVQTMEIVVHLCLVGFDGVEECGIVMSLDGAVEVLGTEGEGALDGRTGIEDEVGLFGDGELILPVHEDFSLVVLVACAVFYGGLVLA